MGPMVETTVDGPDPEFEYENVDGEADPEGNAEELLRQEMGCTAGSEEDTHDRAGGGDAEKDSDGAKFPSSGSRVAGQAIAPRSNKREEKQRVEEEDSGAFCPPADGVRAHGVGGEANNSAESVKGGVYP